jgi:hypothetical protein
MLWYKGWRETRFRGLFLLVIGSLWIVTLSRMNSAPRVGEQPIHLLRVLSIFWMAAPIMLAGAGVKTQPSLQTTKGIHVSMYFTLSLPITRFRLLAVRATMGVLGAIVVIASECLALWIVAPALGVHPTRSDGLEYFVTVSACALGFYCLSLLLATFLDDLWQIWGSMIVIGSLFWLSNTVAVPPSLNIFRAMGEASPLFTHAIPWAPISVSLGLGAVLFCVAVRIVQTHEY